MPDGKKGGLRCVQLTDEGLCHLYGQPDRPAICNRLTPSLEMCGTTDAYALAYLSGLEDATTPH